MTSLIMRVMVGGEEEYRPMFGGSVLAGAKMILKSFPPFNRGETRYSYDSSGCLN